MIARKSQYSPAFNLGWTSNTHPNLVINGTAQLDVWLSYQQESKKKPFEFVVQAPFLKEPRTAVTLTGLDMLAYQILNIMTRTICRYRLTSGELKMTSPGQWEMETQYSAESGYCGDIYQTLATQEKRHGQHFEMETRPSPNQKKWVMPCRDYGIMVEAEYIQVAVDPRVTEKQSHSLHSVITQQGDAPMYCTYNDREKTLGLTFPNIFIGIEGVGDKDGYAHT